MKGMLVNIGLLTSSDQWAEPIRCKELQDWYIDCALAFQASEMGLSPISCSMSVPMLVPSLFRHYEIG